MVTTAFYWFTLDMLPWDFAVSCELMMYSGLFGAIALLII
jgi:hypothetical protein